MLFSDKNYFDGWPGGAGRKGKPWAHPLSVRNLFTDLDPASLCLKIRIISIWFNIEQTFSPR
jgi:hypothetical protein